MTQQSGARNLVIASILFALAGTGMAVYGWLAAARPEPRAAEPSPLGTADALQAAFVAVAAVWTSYAKVMASERLKVGRVEVRGSHFLSEGEVRELLGPAVGENILLLDIEALKGRLRASPWVADARVGRTLPDTLKVEIRERVPLALAECERLYLMDGDGGLIDIYDSACSEVTMYGYGTEGETKKRTLEPTDIAGIQTLYP